MPTSLVGLQRTFWLPHFRSRSLLTAWESSKDDPSPWAPEPVWPVWETWKKFLSPARICPLLAIEPFEEWTSRWQIFLSLSLPSPSITTIIQSFHLSSITFPAHFFFNFSELFEKLMPICANIFSYFYTCAWIHSSSILTYKYFTYINLSCFIISRFWVIVIDMFFIQSFKCDLPMFSWKTDIILLFLTFQSLIDFRLIVLYNIKYKSNVTTMQMATQLSKYYILKYLKIWNINCIIH